MRIVIAGEDPFTSELARLAQNAGHRCDAYLIEDFLSAIESTVGMEALAEADMVLEIHNESADTKQELLYALGNNTPANAVILTSVLPVSTTLAASWVAFSERVVGFSVIPPLETTGVVELARGLQTDRIALAQAREFWDSIGYTIEIVSDGPGLVRARILGCLINEACSALMENVATAADIDRAMKLGTNYPHGPLEWADYMGVDAVLGIMEGLYNEWGEDRYRPSPLLRRMVAAGHLGRKAGIGFYRYA